MTAIYALRNLDVILGLGGEFAWHGTDASSDRVIELHLTSGPEPLTRLVSSYHISDLLTKTEGKIYIVLTSLLPRLLYLDCVRRRFRNGHDDSAKVVPRHLFRLAFGILPYIRTGSRRKSESTT